MQNIDTSRIQNMMKILGSGNVGVFTDVLRRLAGSVPTSIQCEKYMANSREWYVFESPSWKVVVDEDDSYHFFFDKRDGFTLRFGKTVDDDPDCCELGPEILDFEIVAGKCPKINGRNCAFCYKNNGGDSARCTTFDQFKHVFHLFPKNLTQIAFGITGYYTNPDYGRMLEYAREHGVIPNYTTNGVDLDQAAIEHTLDCCGRVAVSCYEGAKEICYKTIKAFGDAASARNRKFPCNIHVVLSKGTFAHVMEVLKDAVEKKIENLGSVVILRMKPVGRAAVLDAQIPADYYRQIVRFCLDNHVSFGFDSCGAKSVAKVLEEFGRSELISSVEPCESTRMSFYVACDGKATPCSFCEKKLAESAIDMFKISTHEEFIHTWNINPMLSNFRKNCINCDHSCQMFELD